VDGSWKTIPVVDPIRDRRRESAIDQTSSPRNDTAPSVGRWSPTSTRARVDLPQPDSPTTPTVSPAAMVRSAPVSA
jgi:hypothetical protein